MALKHGACFGELLKNAPLILLHRLDRAVSTGPPLLHDLRRRSGQRAERAQQARVFVSPFFVFGWKHPSNPKRVGNGPTVRRERIDHSKPLQNIARTEFPSGHLARPRDSGERSASPPGALPRHRHPKPRAGAAEVSRVGGRDRLSRRRQAASARPRWRDHQAGDRRRGHRKPGGLKQVAREGERHDAFVT
jgi:hypothetical protein